MEKYKVCPTCGTKNPPTMMECINCETDLTGVPIGEILAEPSPESVSPASAPADSSKMVSICECGAKNLPSARKCTQCGEDISDIMPTLDTATEGEQTPLLHYVLASLDGQYAFELVSNLTVIGRENTMQEYLAQKPYVSRKHAEILLEGDKLWIKSYKNTNHTFVNNQQIKDDEFIELHDGEVVGFGGREINGQMQDQAAYFRVRIGTCI